MDSKRKFGVLDSGLGGLIVLREIRKKIPELNYVFFGDQAHVPYGEKSVEELFEYSTQIISYLYEKENCAVVLLACNTTSSSIFEKLKAWREEKYPDRFLLSIIEPTVEATPKDSPIALLGTTRTIESGTYQKEFVNRGQEIFPIVLPQLAIRIERGEEVESYLQQFSLPKKEMNAILGCTHYGIVKDAFKKIFPQVKNFICQEDLLPGYIKSFLDKNKEFSVSLSKEGTIKILVSAESEVFDKWLKAWFGETKRELISADSML